MVTHLEPDRLECEVTWALGSITRNKATGGDGIPAELFKFLKDDAVKVLHSICQQIWKIQYWNWPQDWKRSVFIPIPKKGNAKECSNYCTIAFISHTRKVMLKILQVRLQQFVNLQMNLINFQMFKLDLEKAEEPEINCQHPLDHWKSKREFQKKHHLLLYWLRQSFFCVDHNKLENSERDGNTRPPDLPLEKSVRRSRSNS